MEAAFLNLIGSALTLLAIAQRGTPARVAVPGGRSAIAAATAHGVPHLGFTIATAAHAIWSGLDAPEADRGELVAVLNAAADSIVNTANCNVSLARIAPIARDLGTPNERIDAADAIAAAVHCDVAAEPGHERTVELCAVTHLTVAAILACGETLGETLTEFASALDASAREGARPRAGTPASLADLEHHLCAATGISPALVSALVGLRRAAGRNEADIAQAITDDVVAALDVLTTIMRLADNTGSDDALEEALLDVAASMRKGALDSAATRFDTAIRDVGTRERAGQSLVFGDPLHPKMLAARAGLAALALKHRDAATLFDRAAQDWPRDDRLRRWTLKLRQARELVTLGMAPDAKISGLCEAAQVYAAAGGMISERDAPLPWAEATLELGQLLLLLGDRESRPERYLAAALHFKPALEVFTRERAMDGWARSQIGLAHALRGQGSFQGDTVTLAEAAFAYRATLGIMTQAVHGDAWHEARSCLGDTLVRIGEETGDLDALQEAIELLMPLTDARSSSVGSRARAVGEQALARAMLAVAEGAPVAAVAEDRAGDTVVAEALGLLEGVLARSPVALTALELARALHTLGDAHWLVTREGNRPSHLARAITTKKKARDIYESLDQLLEAERIDAELREMRACLGARPPLVSDAARDGGFSRAARARL